MDSMRTPLQTSSRSVFSRYQGSIQAENIPPGRIIDQTTITSIILPEGIIWSTRTLWNWPTTGFKCPQILFYSGSKTPNIASWVIQFSLRFIAIQGKAYFSSNTGCPTKNYTLFWGAVAPLNFELGIKVGGVLESSSSQLFKTVPTFDFWPS